MARERHEDKHEEWDSRKDNGGRRKHNASVQQRTQERYHVEHYDLIDLLP